MMRCPDCPPGERCVVEWTGHTTYCDWAKRGGMWRHRVIELSAKPPEQHQVEAAEALRLVRAMKACLFRSVAPGCCSGGKCALRSAAVVSHIDCFDCIRTYG